jgi:hypothetical protein
VAEVNSFPGGQDATVEATHTSFDEVALKVDPALQSTHAAFFEKVPRTQPFPGGHSETEWGRHVASLSFESENVPGTHLMHAESSVVVPGTTP